MTQIYQELNTKDGVLRGFLHKPENQEKCPLVILFHGFSGSKVEGSFLFVQFARFLCQNNIACLRFDFIGSGDSDYNFEEMTFNKEVYEGEEVLNYAKTLPFVSEIIVLGLSMGGAVATQVCKNNPQVVSKMILWAPAGNMKSYTSRVNELPKMENGNYDLEGLELSYNFIKEFETIDLFLGIEAFKNPVAIFHGENDLTVPVDISRKYNNIYEDSQLFVIDNANHVFKSILNRKELFDLSVKFILK